MDMDFSIIIPAFNEKGRLPPFLSALVEEISQTSYKAEIIIVDDGGSKENHQVYLNAVSSINSLPIKLIRNDKNRGKGAAIQDGFKRASGTWIGFVDADGATSPSEIIRLIKIALTSNNLDGVFGARVRMLGHKIDRSLKRHLGGRFFATLCYLFLPVPVYDSQCGCKFFKHSKILPLLELCQEKKYLFDYEIISLGYFNQLRFIEVPIDWSDVAGSKVHFIRDAIKMIFGILKLSKRVKKLTRK